MRSILDHESKILFDTDTEPLLTPGFWILPLYRELLNSASRNRPSPASERARGSTGLVKIICKENKEQRGKRKYHDGTPHPKDRGGFTQWFGSCSLINTLYVWFPPSWAPIVAEQLFERSSKSDDIQHGQPARGLSQNPSRGHAWHQPTHEFAGPSGTTTEAENEVMYTIRRWSLPGAAVMPVLNVSSRVTWLELDDKALLDSYAVLQEGILCDVFSQKCSAAWQGAPGQRLTVSIMLPGRQLADEWLDFMLSQRNLWPTFTTKGAPTEMITERTFRKERRRLQAKHLWMDIKITWDLLFSRMYTEAPTGMSREQLYDLLFNRATKGNQRNPYEEKAYRGPDYKEVQERWEQSQWWMWHAGPGHQWLHTCIQGQGWECSCRDWYIHGLLCKAVANKGGHIPAQTAKTLTWCERSARAGRWRSGHDGHLINYMDGMEDTLQGGRDEMRGFGGARRFHHLCEDFHRLFFVCFLVFVGFVFWVGVVCWALSVLLSLSRWKTPASNSSFTFFAFVFLGSWPTMPRARSAMQEKKKIHQSSRALRSAILSVTLLAVLSPDEMSLELEEVHVVKQRICSLGRL